MIPSIYKAVSKMNILKGVLPWTYFKEPCILSWLDLSLKKRTWYRTMGTFSLSNFLKIFAIFYIKG